MPLCADGKSDMFYPFDVSINDRPEGLFPLKKKCHTGELMFPLLLRNQRNVALRNCLNLAKGNASLAKTSLSQGWRQRGAEVGIIAPPYRGKFDNSSGNERKILNLN